MALSYLLQKGFDGLGSLIFKEFGLIKGLDKEIESLRSTLSTILAEVADAEKKQLKDTALKVWLAKLKHAAYDVDDILDEFQSEASRRELETQDPVTKKMRSIFSVSKPGLFGSPMARKVKDARDRLYAIAEEQSKFHLIAGAAGIFDTEVVEKTDSWVIESEVYGRNEDKKTLIETLLDVGRAGELSVIPIVGMGGLGKTTLAQLVYNDAGVMKHFDLRIWVCVSDDFDVKGVTKAIIDSPAIAKCDSEELDSLQCHLRQELKGRRLLLVLDDVWEEHPRKWERLRSFLQSGATGSKIIVTTRSAKVALFMGTLPPCHLVRLSDDDCWTLFKQRAFGRGQEENPNLVALGKEIVKKCGGVPLAAKALGSMMRFRTNERQWEFIKDDEIWNFPEEENGILPALRLSYYQLSPQLKQCFAYCSIFPKDHQIKTHELILLWMGEGFIQPTQGSHEMEDIGREYFNNLMWRSFFQEPKEDDDGNIVSCKMHDLMHDLAVSVSGEVCSIVKDGNMASILNECRHLSLVSSSDGRIPAIELTASNGVEKLRTLLIFGYQIRLSSFDISIHLPRLRVLDLRGWKEITKDMLNSISGLKQLRYLCLSLRDRMSSLPESWSKLHNLQSLTLTDSKWLTELPRDMRRMTSLRHLQITECGLLTRTPAKMGELKFLQTLPVFIVGEEESGCNIRELQELKLGGELELRKLENVRSRENAAEATLNEKADLRILRFSWSDDIDDSMRGSSEQTLEGLQPHKNLKRLTVLDYGGERFPRWMSDSSLLRNLTYLSLSCCKRCEELPSLGQLPLLKSLLIYRMGAVTCIGSRFYGRTAFPFPSLEDLTFGSMPNFEVWSSSSESQPQALSRLEKLRLSGCPKLTAIPTCFPSLSSLTIEMFEGDSLPVDLFQNQTHLSTLILNCRKLKSLPRELGNLAALHNLQIEQCDELTSLRLEGGFTSLRALSIYRCFNLESFVGEMRHLTALESLNIGGCRRLGSLPEGMEHLTALTSLSISNCPRVACLPEGLKHARMLKDLRICHLPSFAALPEWIHDLFSLQSLYIESCENLVALPSGLQHLSNLKFLTIDGCPQLEKRCEEVAGEDWDKISHIPKVQIIPRIPNIRIDRLQI
ncbi:hypothetical protein ACLOJK_024722 [Asimina triloba]